MRHGHSLLLLVVPLHIVNRVSRPKIESFSRFASIPYVVVLTVRTEQCCVQLVSPVMSESRVPGTDDHDKTGSPNRVWCLLGIFDSRSRTMSTNQNSSFSDMQMLTWNFGLPPRLFHSFLPLLFLVPSQPTGDYYLLLFLAHTVYRKAVLFVCSVNHIQEWRYSQPTADPSVVYMRWTNAWL
jgi:hypothetical protein